MLERRQEGTCTLCGTELRLRQMREHLNECAEEYRREVGPLDDDIPPDTYELAFQSDRAPFYWLILQVRKDATLKHVDTFLRDIWMGREESSRFVLAANVFSSNTGSSVGGPDVGRSVGDLSVTWEEVVNVDEPFDYAYGREGATELTGRVVTERPALPDQPDTPVRLLARNNAPDIPCECGRNATRLCPECSDDRSGWLCSECAEDHDCRPSAEAYPEIENSPRAAVRAF